MYSNSFCTSVQPVIWFVQLLMNLCTVYVLLHANCWKWGLFFCIFKPTDGTASMLSLLFVTKLFKWGSVVYLNKVLDAVWPLMIGNRQTSQASPQLIQFLHSSHSDIRKWSVKMRSSITQFMAHWRMKRICIKSNWIQLILLNVNSTKMIY